MVKKEVRRYLVIAVIIIAICYIVKNFSFFENLASLVFSAAFPLLLGVIIAYIFNILLRWYEKHFFPKSRSDFVKFSRRPACIILSFFSALALIMLILTIVIPEMINAVKLISLKIPPLLVEGRDLLLKKLDEYPDIQKEAVKLFAEFDVSSIDWTSTTQKIADFVQSGVLGIITSAVGIVDAITSTVVDIVLAIIFAVYILFRKDKILRDGDRFMKIFTKEKFYMRVKHILKVANKTFQDFFVGQFLDAMILGCLCFIGMSIIRLPYAGMSSVLVGVTALIPIVGAFLGAGISAFIIFTESPFQAMIFIILILILQQLEGNLIYPKVVGDSVGLPGIWVLAATTFGGGLWGFMGMLVGVPIAATIYKLLFEKLRDKEAAAGIDDPDAVVATGPKFSVSSLFRRKRQNNNRNNNNRRNR